MVQFGLKASHYLQAALKPKIDRILAKNSDIYKNYSHFINCAIIREIRRIDNYAPLCGDKEEAKGRHSGSAG